MLIPIAYLEESSCIFTSASVSISCRPDRDHLVDGTVADDFPHHGFGNMPERPTRLSDLEQELGGIRRCGTAPPIPRVRR